MGSPQVYYINLVIHEKVWMSPHSNNILRNRINLINPTKFGPSFLGRWCLNVMVF
jgi:hypothetical protein